ncbi:MAG: hypothetical protein K6T92_02760 [Candidatus Rokubacteria bacterium]|nr:hypothetical protein [Candidatus Rokubacteria bacterium]
MAVGVVGWGPVVALGALAAWLGWRSRAWPLVHDAPIMHYIAWRMADGAVPYRDLFDMNFPGTYLLHLAVLALLGPGDAAWRVFDLLWLAAGAAAVAALAATWGSVAATGGALFFVAHHLAGGAWQAGQRDFLLCPLLLAGALGVARWLEQPGRLAGLAWGGLALGAGLTIKPHVGLLAAALAGLVARRADRPERRRALALFGAGLAAAPLAVVGWLAAAGALPAWRAIVLDYLIPLYSRLGWPAEWGFHRWPVWIPIALAMVLSVGAAVVHRRFGPRHAVAVVGVLYGVVHYVGQGKGWEYHLYPLAAFAAVLLFSELPALLAAGRWLAGGLIAVSLAAGLAGLAAKGAEAADAADSGWIADKQRRVQAVVGALAGRLGPEDRVQGLDTAEGGVHALLRLGAVAPTRFLYDFHFFHDVDTPMVQALRRELLDGLQARPPRFIVLFARGWPAGGYERLDLFPELQRFLTARYRLEQEADGFRIYAKRDDP